MNRFISASLAISCVLVVGCASPAASWNEGANTPATPQRPTYSRSTYTTAPGTVEVEGGISLDPSDALATPTSVKYGVSDRGEAFVDLNPATAVEGGGVGFGDIYLGWRRRLTELQEAELSFAYQAMLKLPTADEDKGLGTGELDALLAGIGTVPMQDWSMTGFAEVGLVGDPTGSGADLQLAFAGAADHGVGGGAGLFGELAGIFVPDQDFNSVFATLGGFWSPVPGLVLDTGIVLGLSSDAPDLAFLIGFTRNLGPARGYSLARQ